MGSASDLFSFGAILYETLSAKRAFQAETAAETVSAILKEEPPELSAGSRQIPPALERFVRHCLEKNPEERFQSARDVAFDLESLSSTSGSTPVKAQSGSAGKSSLFKWAAIGLGVLVAFAAGILFARSRGVASRASYHRLTFRQGTIQSAHFTPDGQSVVYSASWEGNPSDIFTTRPQAPESRSLGLSGSSLLSVSRTGELAALMGMHPVAATYGAGTLARVPMEGGAPREVQSNVENADWGPDGATLLLTHEVGGFDRMEFPPGKLIYQNPGIVGHPRFSPRGNLIGFFEHPGRVSDDGSVAVVDLAGKKTVLSTGWADLTGLAWSPGGDEIWFTGDRNNSSLGLFAVTLDGNERQVERVPGDLILYDIARDGRVLMGREEWRGGMYALAPGQDHERDLSWFDFSIAADISHDGGTVLFYELGEMGGALSPSLLRGTDGAAAVRLSDGLCAAFSHDGQRVICTGSDGQLNEVPTKSGEIKPMTHDHLVHGLPQWFPDEKRIAFLGQEPGHGLRVYVQDLDGGEPKAITPEGAGLYFQISPDGKQVAVSMGTDFRIAIYPVSGGNPRPTVGFEPGQIPAAWSPDDRYLYVYRLGNVPLDIFQVEIATGRRALWRRLSTPDPIGITFMSNIYFSSDMKSYVYSINRRLDVLYLVEGLR